MTIGELGRQTGVSADTIRYYERIGLMPRPQRTPGGYRDYPAGAAAMSERKQHIAYRYVGQPAGASVVIQTTDAATRDAIHAFLRYQIVEHKTGDPLTVR